jgi:hypothetical protein
MIVLGWSFWFCAVVVAQNHGEAMLQVQQTA